MRKNTKKVDAIIIAVLIAAIVAIVISAVRSNLSNGAEASTEQKYEHIEDIPLSELAKSFARTFIVESRWMLIVEGVITTAIITVLSAIFGTLLGFLLVLFRRTGSRLAGIICKPVFYLTVNGNSV